MTDRELQDYQSIYIETWRKQNLPLHPSLLQGERRGRLIRLTCAQGVPYLRMCSVTVMVNPEGEAIMVDLEELVSVILSPWTFLKPLDSRSS